MIEFAHTGDWKKTKSFLSRASNMSYADILNRYGTEGVRLLSSATPVSSGKTASSWTYEVIEVKGKYTVLSFNNTNVINGIPIAVILQYGHGTRNGGYVTGIDYINPALKPLFDKIASDAWKEITRR